MLPRAVALLLVGVVGGAVLTGSPSAPARVVWYRPRTVVVLADRADSGGADGGDDGGVVCRSWAGVRRTDSGDADGGWRLLTAVSMPWRTSRSKSTTSIDDVAITTIAQVVTATGRDAR